MDVENALVREEPKVVIGLDFGTTFSGFAYVCKPQPEKTYIFEDWPMQPRPYCKCRTMILYSETDKGFEVKEWGWPAQVCYLKTLEKEEGKYYFLKEFKLALASLEGYHLPSELVLPEQVISDYLSSIGKFALEDVKQRIGSHLTMEDVQWSLTVPAIWDESSKQIMKTCAEAAGLVKGPGCPVEIASPHDLILVLEPEAASVYCLKRMHNLKLRNGDRFIVVDVGGGTVDLSTFEKVGDGPNFKLKQVQRSSGEVTGGVFVDREFLSFLDNKIEIFSKFSEKHPSVVIDIQRSWESMKCTFDGRNKHMVLNIPQVLATAWEESSCNPSGCFDEIVVTVGDMERIFEPVVFKVLKVIESNISEGIKLMLVVGGFSTSEYLMARIREAFEQVMPIIRPTDPGSAICCGAAILGCDPDIITCRISRKTYGVAVVRRFMRGDPPDFMVGDEEGRAYCSNVFDVFVRRNQEVPTSYKVRRKMNPFRQDQKGISIVLFSTLHEDPKFTTGEGVVEEGRFSICIPTGEALGHHRPLIDVTMYFGRTKIEVTAKGLNFDSEAHQPLVVMFSRDLIS